MNKLKITCLTLSYILISSFCWAQQEERFEIVDVIPQPQGGMFGLYKHIGKNLEYTDLGLDNKIEGKIMVEFVVSKTGDILADSTKILEGLGFGLDEKVVELVNNFPTWTPGYITKLGIPAPVRMILPITYKIPPSTSEAWSFRSINKAKEFMNKNDISSALTIMDNAIVANPKLGNNYFMRAVIHQSNENNKSTCKDLKKANKLGYSSELFNTESVECTK